MSHNTIAINQSRQDLSRYEEIWLFGYGSLIYKVDFPILAKAPGHIKEWARRFWQGSHDHRGTPDKPGRVATLIESPQSVCHGMAYQVSSEVFEHLDHREKNGYLRYEMDIYFANGQIKQGLVYIAPTDNDAFLGPASEQDIAKHIAASCGPSGENSEYLLALADALRVMQVDDNHVFEIERYLLASA